MYDPSIDICSTCDYYEPREGETKGNCIRFPPTVVELDVSLDRVVADRQPRVSPTDSCGECTVDGVVKRVLTGL